MQRRSIRYHRFSSDGQSQSSIERQALITLAWCTSNDVFITDTFVDEGHSARTFDRPDIKKLFDFIARNYRNIDYLVVSELTRFSRELGDAVNMVKDIQKKYNIKIVSASRNAIYDVYESTSFFVMSLEFLLGNSENIKRSSDINGGIYAAKKKEGRYIGAAPFGYKNIRLENGKPGIAPDEEKMKIVKLIFEKYLSGTPLNEIVKHVRKLGFAQKGNSAMQRILTNRVYIGMLHVKAFKENAEEWVQGIHTPIIDNATFHIVQSKMRKGNPVQLINDDFPLRGTVLCHCGVPLTGAPSRGRWGGYYNYYKCKVSGHNNVSATFAHKQLHQVWQHMSLSSNIITAVKSNSEKMIAQTLKENNKNILVKRHELAAAEEKLHSVEDKWILNQMAFDTYQRWHTELTEKRMLLHAEIEDLQRIEKEAWYLMHSEIEKLGDLDYVYTAMPTEQKQQMVRIVFDSRLYYQQKIYRTPYVLDIFKHNLLILKQKQLLELDEKREFLAKLPSGGAHGSLIEPSLLSFFRLIQVA